MNRQNFIINLKDIVYCVRQNALFAASAGYFWDGALKKDSEFTEALTVKFQGKLSQGEIFWVPKNGQFGVVAQEGNFLFAAVDRTRSFPLFYGVKKGKFYLSNKAHWLKEKLQTDQLDPVAQEEFRLAGFVAGNDTLFRDLKQIQAGHYILVEFCENKFSIKVHQYFKYIGAPKKNALCSNLRTRLDEVFLASFRRLIKFADGRTLVVPLSAGLDSRLVAAMLKRLNYENVICYSYGKENNRESGRSAEIARQLGFKWLFVPYAGKMWKKWSSSIEFKSYMRYADNLSTLPHIQDWPAVFTLREKKMIPDDSIFVPGHTGDFISGGHIQPDFMDEHVKIDKNQLIIKIVKKHYRVNDFLSCSKAMQTKIKQRIEATLQISSVESNEQAAFLYEFYDWQERQPKHVLNSLRVYEFFGYKWYLPLWDVELLEFWQQVPLKMKVNKVLYLAYLGETNMSNLFGELRANNETAAPMKGTFRKNKLLYRSVESLASARDFIKKQYFDYFNHDLAWYGMFPYSKVAFGKKRFQNIYSFLVDSYLAQFE